MGNVHPAVRPYAIAQLEHNFQGHAVAAAPTGITGGRAVRPVCQKAACAVAPEPLHGTHQMKILKETQETRLEDISSNQEALFLCLHKADIANVFAVVIRVCRRDSKIDALTARCFHIDDVASGRGTDEGGVESVLQ